MGELKVIGAGFPRTGTTTLKKCLEILGYDKCYHMKELFVKPERLKYWLELDRTGQTDWDTLFKGYQACVDVPGYPYYKKLMERYPDAKVILTHRPFDQWYESASTTVRKAGPQTILEKLGMLWQMLFDGNLRKRVKAIQFFEGIFWDKQFQGQFNDKTAAQKVFHQHIEEVQSYVPEDRLLVYDVSQGWEPLCQFLGKEIPEQPFPHLNKKENFKEMLGHLIKGEMA